MKEVKAQNIFDIKIKKLKNNPGSKLIPTKKEKEEEPWQVI